MTGRTDSRTIQGAVHVAVQGALADNPKATLDELLGDPRVQAAVLYHRYPRTAVQRVLRDLRP